MSQQLPPHMSGQLYYCGYGENAPPNGGNQVPFYPTIPVSLLNNSQAIHIPFNKNGPLIVNYPQVNISPMENHLPIEVRLLPAVNASFPLFQPISNPFLASPLYGDVIANNMSLESDQLYQLPVVFAGPADHFGITSFQRSLSSNSANVTLKRSQLLEDFRNKLLNNLTLSDVRNHFDEFSRDQLGSRFIQQSLEKATSSELDILMEDILLCLVSLCHDVFGNYVIQKLIEHAAPHHRKSILIKIKSHFVELSFNQYACRVVQKATEMARDEDRILLASELKGLVKNASRDSNANHVLQKFIEKLKHEEKKFILDELNGTLSELSCHINACRIVQRLWQFGSANQRCCIFSELQGNFLALLKDQFGNYVVQTIVETGGGRERGAVIEAVFGSVVYLCQHKYASNVIEKLISFACSEDRKKLIREICSIEENTRITDSVLLSLMRNQFANYVIQKMLDLCDEGEANILLPCITPHIPILKTFPYGKHILLKLDRCQERFKVSSSSDAVSPSAIEIEQYRIVSSSDKVNSNYTNVTDISHVISSGNTYLKNTVPCSAIQIIERNNTTYCKQTPFGNNSNSYLINSTQNMSRTNSGSNNMHCFQTSGTIGGLQDNAVNSVVRNMAVNMPGPAIQFPTINTTHNTNSGFICSPRFGFERKRKAEEIGHIVKRVETDANIVRDFSNINNNNFTLININSVNSYTII